MIVLATLGVYGIVYVDVVSRAKESYQEAEKYMDWYHNPQKKTDFYEKKFLSDKAKLDEELAKKKLSDEEYKEKISALEFDKEYTLSESSLKYAYQWYKDTYELFSPPESKWVKMARAKSPEVLELWKQELREQKVPFEDTMFD
jgi:hypothetical protein